MEDDPVVLTYGDTTLYESDVALLEPHQWLNDSIISFWFAYLLRCPPPPNKKHNLKGGKEDWSLIGASAALKHCETLRWGGAHRYLSNEILKEHQDEVLFVDPSAMFMVAFSGEQVAPLLPSTLPPRAKSCNSSQIQRVCRRGRGARGDGATGA